MGSTNANAEPSDDAIPLWVWIAAACVVAAALLATVYCCCMSSSKPQDNKQAMQRGEKVSIDLENPPPRPPVQPEGAPRSPSPRLQEHADAIDIKIAQMGGSDDS